MIEIKNLTKRYGHIRAVNNISFDVGRGEIVGFLGPNGAGKTTTMNIIAGYIPATSGVVTVNGYDVMEDPEAVKSMIGYLPENPPLYMDLTVGEYLGFVSELKKTPASDRKKQIDDALELMELGDHRGRLIRNLSKGYRQRVGFAQALLGAPRLLILDEPTVGLDPKQIIGIRKTIVELGRTHTIILSSHILQEVSAVCERVVIINKGKIVAVDTPENLSRGLGKEQKLTVTIHGDNYAVIAAATGIPGVRSIEMAGSGGMLRSEDGTGHTYTIEAEPGADVRKPLFFAMAGMGFPITEMRSMDMSLEEVFMELVESDAGAADVARGAGSAEGGDLADIADAADAAADVEEGAYIESKEDDNAGDI